MKTSASWRHSPPRNQTKSALTVQCVETDHALTVTVLARYHFDSFSTESRGHVAGERRSRSRTFDDPWIAGPACLCGDADRRIRSSSTTAVITSMMTWSGLRVLSYKLRTTSSSINMNNPPSFNHRPDQHQQETSRHTVRTSSQKHGLRSSIRAGQIPPLVSSRDARRSEVATNTTNDGRDATQEYGLGV